MSETFQSMVLKVVEVCKKPGIYVAYVIQGSWCVLFLNCVEGVNMCRGHYVSTAGCQCSHRGSRGGGELTGNSGVTSLCCLWSADVLTI